MKKFFSVCTFLLSASVLANELEQKETSIKPFVQFQPIPLGVTLGAYKDIHRAGLYASQGSEKLYRALGLEYAIHPEGVTSTGGYGKVYALRRWYNEIAILKGDTYVETSDHTANHYGAIVGYQGQFNEVIPLYLQLGIGWQYNDNPVKSNHVAIYGFGQDMRSWQEATGDVALVWYF